MKINLKNKKYLLTSGCSFTDGFQMHEKGSWAYYLSDMLNLKLINKARGGSGNEYISDSVIIELMNNEEIRNQCIVIVAWSDNTRLMSSIYDGKGHVLDSVQPQDFISDEHGKRGRFSHKQDARFLFSDIPFCAYKTYLSILKLSSFLESLNIPYVYLDAISPNEVSVSRNGEKITMYGHTGIEPMEFNLLRWPYQYREVFNSKFNDNIFQNFIEVNEHKTILDFLWSDYNHYTEGNPGHPNDIASKEVAESIFNQISK